MGGLCGNFPLPPMAVFFYIYQIIKFNKMKEVRFTRFLVVIFLSVSLFSCVNKSQQAEQKGDFIVELLFEKNGCKMYRFKDGGRFIYWSDCSGKVNSDYTISTGKTTYTHRVESITSK